MKKKIFALMLSAIMAVTMLVGCGDSVETGGRVETGEDRGREETSREKQESGESAENDVGGMLGSFLAGIFGESEPKEVTVCVKETYHQFAHGHNPGSNEYEYDASSNRTKETYYVWVDGVGHVSHCYEWEYDAAGNLTKETEYDSNGNGHIVYEAEYITISLD